MSFHGQSRVVAIGGQTLRWNLVSSVGTCALVGSSEADQTMREVMVEEDMVDGRSDGVGEKERTALGI